MKCMGRPVFWGFIVLKTGDGRPRKSHLNKFFDPFDKRFFHGIDQKHGVANAVSSGRAAHAVNIVFGEPRHIEVDHMADVFDIDAPGR